LRDSELVDENTILIKNIYAGGEIEWDVDSFRNAQMAKTIVGRQNNFEFRYVMGNTTATGANDVMTKFVCLSEIILVHWGDVWTRLRPLLFFDLKVRKLSI
jgi:hypothetical protein